MRKKIPEKDKKNKFAISIDEKLSDILNSHLKNINFTNKSKYIECLIRKDMEERGKDVNQDF